MIWVMSIKSILFWIVVVGLFAIPAVIPFIVSSSLFFPFITGKAFTFRIIVEVIFVFWFLLAMCDKAYRPRFSNILLAVGIFIGVLMISDFFAQNPHKAFWSNYERMEGFVSIFHMALYFIVAGSILVTEKLWINFFRLNVLTSIFLSFYGFFQLAGKITINQGGVRVDGTLGNASYFGGYVMIMIFLSLFLLARDNKSWWKWVYMIAIVFDSVILYHSATRGALLGLIGGILLSTGLVVFLGKDRPIFKRISLVILFLVLIISGFVYLYRDNSFVQKHAPLARLTSINTNSADAQARFMVWEMAWQGFKEKPIFGWGQEGFNFVFNKYYNPNMYNRESWFDRTHNVVFDWLIAGGLLGFLAYFYLVVLFFVSIWKLGQSPKESSFSVVDKSILTGLGAGYVFQNFFVFDNIMSYILFFSLLAFLHWHISQPIKKMEMLEEVPVPEIPRFYLPVGMVALVAVVWFVNIPSIQASRDLINALRAQPSGIIENLKYFKKAIGRNGLGNQEIREQLGQAASSIFNSRDQSITDDIKLQFFTLAINELKKEVENVPNDARTQLFLGQLYSFVGSSAEEIKHYEEALKNSPNKQTIQIALAFSYLKVGKYNDALELAKKAYENTPGSIDIASSYLAVAIYVRNGEEVKRILNKSFSGEMPLDSKVIQALMDTKQFDTVVKLVKQGIVIEPDNLQLRLVLATSYLKAGLRSSAVSTIREIIAKDVRFKEQGEYLINEIQAGRNP
jgi:O-antigen ligase/tetratricopeptide (TPR) repeat protein